MAESAASTSSTSGGSKKRKRNLDWSEVVAKLPGLENKEAVVQELADKCDPEVYILNS